MDRGMQTSPCFFGPVLSGRTWLVCTEPWLQPHLTPLRWTWVLTPHQQPTSLIAALTNNYRNYRTRGTKSKSYGPSFSQLACAHTGLLYHCFWLQVGYFPQELIETENTAKGGWILIWHSPSGQKHDSNWVYKCVTSKAMICECRAQNLFLLPPSGQKSHCKFELLGKLGSQQHNLFNINKQQ